MKRKKIISMLMLMALILLTTFACGSYDSSDGIDSVAIPSGTYVEENGTPEELFTMVVNGYNITITTTMHGSVMDSWSGTYRISGNTITITMSDGTTDKAYFRMNGNKVTIGDITYIKKT